jgi:hypothetical protein
MFSNPIGVKSFEDRLRENPMFFNSYRYVVPTQYITNDGGVSDLPVRSGDNNNQGPYVDSTSSAIYNKNVQEVSFWIKKLGSPTGTATIAVWSNTASGGTKTNENTFGTIDVSTLTGSYVKYTFDTGSHVMAVDDTIGLEFTGGDVSNNPQIRGDLTDAYDGTDTQRGRYSGGAWSPVDSHDCDFEIGYI